MKSWRCSAEAQLEDAAEPAQVDGEECGGRERADAEQQIRGGPARAIERQLPESKRAEEQNGGGDEHAVEPDQVHGSKVRRSARRVNRHAPGRARELAAQEADDGE
jgi:hypothetical protein